MAMTLGLLVSTLMVFSLRYLAICSHNLGGVLTLSSYRSDFNFDDSTATRVSSLAIGLQQLGGFFACFFVWPVTRKLGRKPAISICSCIFIFGALVQTMNSHSMTVFFMGRFIAGVGLGGTSVVVPMFSAEMTPKQMRGQIGSFYQLMFTLGILTSYWTDWAVAKDISDTESRQWQIPVGLQILFAGLLGLGTMTLKESVRWLTMRGRYEEAWESLKWIRASEHEDVHFEMEEIKLGVETEARAKEGFEFKGTVTCCPIIAMTKCCYRNAPEEQRFTHFHCCLYVYSPASDWCNSKHRIEPCTINHT